MKRFIFSLWADMKDERVYVHMANGDRNAYP